MNFSDLIIVLSKVNAGLQEQGIRAVNFSLTLRNWFFGFYIVEFEQNGSDRAGYGKALLANISAEMKCRGIAGVDERELRRYRQFYLAYPAAGHLFAGNSLIQGLAPMEMFLNREVENGVRSPNLKVPDSHYFSLFNNVSYVHFMELGLKQREVLPEKELEQALSDHLLQFLLELLCKGLHNISYAYRFVM